MSEVRSYEAEMSADEADLKQRNFDKARMHFGRTHGLGHQERCRQVMAHRRLVKVAPFKRDLKQAASQAALIGLVYMLDRPTRQG